MIAVITTDDFRVFGLALFVVLAILVGTFIFSWWMNRRSECPSPYTGRSLRKASELSWMSMEKVLHFLFDMHDPDNKMFDFYRATWCRDTGRIFPNSISWLGTMHVNWRFLEKRYPGRWVSWGSLSTEQKLMIEALHESLEGFQTTLSSQNPLPREIEKKWILVKPGPLYVDMETGILLGWKVVPGTDLEVLVVQKPARKPNV